ncbi:hypothetical protein LB545_07715 [Mesorhizobium sp. BR1-1-6]|uniref:hypothetical protein n=1 Tax=Mesorhizobium sp. BR1-1-6 TaxID=2876648 RepID=UPI001CD14FA9|nr:hypothetical protein [Mesorhizobium sp. BR1-1-6]MBZ9894230.1 hypothetical protein [Mesorhizobium sp. BR1-1-6]
MKAATRQKPKRDFASQHIEIGSAIIENPNWSRDHDGDKTNVRYVSQPINIRESAITTLAAKGVINAGQAAAAVRFRAAWERMGGAGAGALDYSKEPVDGGGVVEPITIRQLEAGRELKDARDALKKAHGEYAFRVVCYIAGEGRSIHELTETRRQRDTLTDNLRAYLDVLAVLWEYAGR